MGTDVMDLPAVMDIGVCFCVLLFVGIRNIWFWQLGKME